MATRHQVLQAANVKAFWMQAGSPLCSISRKSCAMHSACTSFGSPVQSDAIQHNCSPLLASRFAHTVIEALLFREVFLFFWPPHSHTWWGRIIETPLNIYIYIRIFCSKMITLYMRSLVSKALCKLNFCCLMLLYSPFQAVSFQGSHMLIVDALLFLLQRAKLSGAGCHKRSCKTPTR